MNNFEKKIFNFIKENNLILQNETPLVAVSGGIDSMVLLNVLINLKDNLEINTPIAAHLNHLLRNEESDRDENFVKEMCKSLKIKFVSQKIHIREIAEVEKNSIQQTARKYRLMFLEEAAKELKCDKILTGHNRNDLSETTLMWICRGTGMKGAAGILPQRGTYIRPLLCVSRKEILNYASEKGILNIEDSSNEKLDYIRNRFRNEIIPSIEKDCYPNVSENIARFAELIKEDLIYIEKKSKRMFDTLCNNENNQITIDINKLLSSPKAISSRIIRYMIKEASGTLTNISQKNIEDILEIAKESTFTGEKKQITLSHNIEVIKTYSKLIVRKYKKVDIKKTEGEFLLKYPGTTIIKELGFKVDIEILPGKILTKTYKLNDSYIAFINLDKINFPLKIRLPKKGDKFSPLGTLGTKKISDFFIDNKINIDERWNIPLLTDEKNIIWVIGHRISELYRISVQSDNVLMIKVTWI